MDLQVITGGDYTKTEIPYSPNLTVVLDGKFGDKALVAAGDRPLVAGGRFGKDALRESRDAIVVDGHFG